MVRRGGSARRSVAVLLGGAMVALASCGEGRPDAAPGRAEPSARSSRATDEPPDWLAEHHRSIAAAGEDLIVVGDGGRDVWRRSPDGRWHPLPPVPDRGHFGFVQSVGDTVVVTGSSCSFSCDSGVLRGYVLSADHDGWRSVDWPDRVRIDSETEFVPNGETDDMAMVFAGGTDYAVDAAGTARALPGRRISGVADCYLSDRIVHVPLEHRPSEPTPEELAALERGEFRMWSVPYQVTGAADVMRIDDGEPTWQRSEHEPPPFTTGFTSFYCDEDATVLIGVGPDQGRELVHSATDDAWTVRDSNFVELTGTAELPRGWDQRVARSPDGRTEFVVLATPDERRLVSRTDDGPWVDMARSPTVVFATDEGVYAFDHTTDTDLVRIWPAG